MSKIESIRRKSILVAVAAVSAGLIYTDTTQGATRTWNGGGIDNLWSTAFNWSPVGAPVAGDALVFDGFGRLTNTNDLAAALSINGITFASTAGAFTLAPLSGTNTITLNGDIADNTSILTQTINIPLILNATRNVNVTTNGFLRLGGVISDGGGGFGLNKTGAGTLTLLGANTFTGPVTIASGVVSISNDNQLGAVPGAPTANKLVVNGGTINTTANMAINANRGIAVGPAGGAGSSIFDVQTGTTVTYAGVIANNTGSTGGLTKTKFGIMVLSGANTYTGPTAIKNGAVNLDFSAASAPVSNIINSVSTLSIGGETAGLGAANSARLVMTGKASTANTQTFASTNIDLYSSLISLTNGATGGTTTLNLGALTHTLGANLVVTAAAANGSVMTTSSNVNGIIGGWAHAGAVTTTRNIAWAPDYATIDNTGKIVAYSAYVTATVSDSTDTTDWHSDPNITGNKNVRINGPASAALYRVNEDGANTTTDINTIAFTNNGFNHTLFIGAGNTLRLGQYGGILKQATGNNQLYVGGDGTNITTGNGTGANIGSLTAGGAPNTAGEIVLSMPDANNNNGGMNILAKIVDNGTGPVSLIKAGVMSVKIDGHNTFSGGTFINQGRFQLAGSETGAANANPDGLGSGPVTIAPGGYLFISGVNGNVLFTGPGAITGALADTAQNAPIVNNMVISGNGTDQEAIGAIRLGGESVVTGTLTLGGDARIGGATTNNANFANSYEQYPAINPDLTTLYVDPRHRIAGRITGNFNFDMGSGAAVPTHFELTNTNNDWTGNTTILNGGGHTVVRLGNNDVIPNGTGKGNLIWGTGVVAANFAVLNMNGFSETVNGLSTTTTNLGSVFIQNDGFTATILDPTPGDKTDDNQTYSFTAGTSTLTVGDDNQSAVFGGVIRDSDTTRTVTLPNPNFEGPVDPEADPATVTVTTPWVTGGAKVALTKIGTGVQQLTGANTYTGATNINGGVLAVNGSLASTGNVNVASGAALAGTGSVGTVTVSSGGALRAGSVGTGSIGTLTLSGPLTMASGTVGVDFGGGLSDLVQVNAAATFTGTNTLTPSGTPTAGTYTVVNSTSPISGAGTFSFTPFPTLPDQRPASGSLNLADPNAIKVVVTGGAKTLNWTGSTSGQWQVPSGGGTFDWSDAVSLANERFFNADIVQFNDTANRNVLLNQNVQPGSVTINNSVGNDYTISGTGSIGGTTSIVKNGQGTAILAANSTNSGGIAVNDGTLKLGASHSGPVTVNGGALHIGAGGTAGSVTGSITNNATLRYDRSDNFSFGNVISGGGTVEKIGTNTVTLTGTSTYTGNTNVLAGTVAIANFQGMGSLTGGAVQVSSGAAVDLGAAGAAGSFGAKQFLIAGTGVGGTGVLTNSGAVAHTAAYQQVLLTADSTVGGTGRFDVRGTGSNLNLNNFTLTKVGTNQFSIVGCQLSDGNVIVNNGTFSVETTSNATPTGLITYNTGSTGMFHLLTGLFERPMKWNGGTMFNNNQAGTSTVDAAMELAVDTPANIGGTGTNAQMILTNTLTGSGGFSKSGTGRLRITGSAQYTGVTNVSDGEIQYQNNFTTGSGINVTGGKLTMMTNGNNVLRSGPISVSATGAVDVNDNDIVVEGQAFTDVLNLVLSGFQVPTGGITSSTSDGSQIHALFDNALVGAGDWLGVPIGANAIVGKYTYFGDANIDGQVTGDDYGVVDANLNTTPPVGLGWLSGDMNLDGSVTGDDYGVIDANLGLGVGNPLSPSSLNVVPEPTSLGLIAAGAGLLLGRRRRRNA